MLEVSSPSEDLVVAELEEEFLFLTTLPFQPKVARSLVFKRVSYDFSCPDLAAYYAKVREEVGRNAIVFLTAVDVRRYLHLSGEGFEVLATVGLSPPACPGYSAGGAGTINLAVLARAPLSESGLADLLRTVAEAKSVAAAELLLRCSSRSPGTVSDAIAVGRPLSLGGELHFVGMGTRLGSAVSRAIYEGLVREGMRRLGAEGVAANALGLGVEEMVKIAVKLYSSAPVPGVSEERARGELREILLRYLADPNVMAFLIAARELDLHAFAGSLPGLSREEAEADSVKIVADELLAFALSLYLAGFKGLLATYWVERLKKEGKVAELPLFEDDVLSALLASALAQLYERAKP
ncbi:MAG: bifunctional adenosylcobinamide hydrolase/alpha-ribazole phosphatase CbiS [Acidilobaceae archaeon]|nr:bifunctional adenosylcobinamide hydrolase/alpha-ribazole phosphatase CbiS [Acidilobaceae archaeon]